MSYNVVFTVTGLTFGVSNCRLIINKGDNYSEYVVVTTIPSVSDNSVVKFPDSLYGTTLNFGMLWTDDSVGKDILYNIKLNSKPAPSGTIYFNDAGYGGPYVSRDNPNNIAAGDKAEFVSAT